MSSQMEECSTLSMQENSFLFGTQQSALSIYIQTCLLGIISTMVLHPTFYTVFAFLCFYPLPIQSAPTDQLSLLDIKEQIIQDPLEALNSWNTSSHFCDWQGVTCDPQRERVIILNLSSNKLIGTLSSSIGNLTALRIINFQNNSFYGEIPQEIGQLISLRGLALSNNSFEGALPANISHCSNLRRLCLASNRLTGKIPPELGSLSKLVLLNFRRNDLTGVIPPSFGNLSSLQHLTLNFNSLTGSLPDSLGHMPSLQYVRIGINNFSGFVPPSMWNLSSLIELYIAYNQIQGTLPLDIGFTLPNLQNFGIAGNLFSGYIPDSLANISSLDYIVIAENKFIGQVPSNFGSLKLLHRFDISSNHLGAGKGNDIFNSLINCSNLEVLNLRDNQFGGVLPNLIGNLSTKLHSFKLGRNQIYGNIPTAVENLASLTELSMEQNLFTGDIPLSIGKLHKLKRLDLSGNRLSGKLPFSLGNISEMYELNLKDNNLTGRIPLSLKSLDRLQRLDISENDLNGSIPGDVIGAYHLLAFLNLSHNSFTFSLPVEVGNLENLEVMDVSENKLSGEIPSSLGDCIKLEQLYMNGNAFRGSLSSFINKLPSVQHLDLSRNNLFGQIPRVLEDAPFLQSLNLSFNNFSGVLPLKGVFRNVTTFSIIGNSRLCGGIPELNLQPCLTKDSNERGKSRFLVIIITTISVVMLCFASIATSVALYWRRKSRQNPTPTSTIGNSYIRVSYEELLHMTGGFSHSNLIGTGSFGSVYKGFLHRDGTPVAVKLLNLQQRGASKSFMAECEALKEIRHRNLLHVLTSCSSVDFKGDEFKALVYKYMSNGSLDDWLHPSLNDQKQLKILRIGQRLDIAINVASALEYLHNHCRAPIVHCDLKPSNVLLDDDLTAHVGDFGLVKFLSTAPNDSGKDEESSIGMLKGSVGYMAPEYGMGGQVSTHGDMYSYGILLLEMFTGKRPTDEMFKDGLSLYAFVATGLTDRVVDIVDPTLLSESQEEDQDRMENNSTESEETPVLNIAAESIRSNIDVTEELLFVSVMRIGLACCASLPKDRMVARDVLNQLITIQDSFGWSLY